MYLFAELWSPQPKWLALSKREREKWMADLRPAVDGLAKAGIELLGMSGNDPETSHRADYRWMAFWRAQDRMAVTVFEEFLHEVKWYDYFRQENMRGESITSEAGVEDMINV